MDKWYLKRIFDFDKYEDIDEQTKNYRNEYKYFIDSGQVEIIRNIASSIMTLDEHVSAEGMYKGMYNIRSIYFDDMDNSCYYDDEDGVDPREKFRIRIYNHSSEFITLELKGKKSGKCIKTGCPLTKEQCEAIIQGKSLPDNKSYPPILQKFLLQIKTRMLHPVVIVEYDRIPYIYPQGNVRVTIDCNIRASCQCTEFLQKDILLRPVLETGRHILEIKWDTFLPDFIYHAMMIDHLQWTSSSKFYMSRHLYNDFF